MELKNFNEFLNENYLEIQVYTGEAEKLAKISNGKIYPVFLVVTTGDSKIDKFVSILYNSIEEYFLVSEKIELSGSYGEREKFLSFDEDIHEKHNFSFRADTAVLAFSLAKLISAFEDPDNLEKYWYLIKNLKDVIEQEHEQDKEKLIHFKELSSEFEKDIKDWENEFEEQVPLEILRNLDVRSTFFQTRKYGL